MPGVRSRAAIGSVVFFLLGPGLEAGVGPFVLSGGWQSGGGLPASWPLRVVGVVLIAAGLVVLVHAFVRFAVDGAGTPSPAAPTRRLVVHGAYRHVRNPMYLASAAVIAGQGLVLRQPILLGAAAVFVAAFAVWVRRREEPVLARRFGASYDDYRRAVPAWRPRLRPWSPTR
jgi:protein-S-isoprenylcysteine O-methyltransferase Ste14